MAVLTPPLPPRPLYLEWDLPAAATDAGWSFEVWHRLALGASPVLLRTFPYGDTNFWHAVAGQIITYRVPISAGLRSAFFTLTSTNAALGFRWPPKF